MCIDEEEVTAASGRIEELGRTLEVTMATHKGQLRSKVSMVLMKERPEHFAALCAAKVI